MTKPTNPHPSRDDVQRLEPSGTGENGAPRTSFLRGLVVGVGKIVAALVVISAISEVLYAIGWAFALQLRVLGAIGAVPSTPWVMASDASLFLVSAGAAALMLLGLVIMVIRFVARLGGWRGKAPRE